MAAQNKELIAETWKRIDDVKFKLMMRKKTTFWSVLLSHQRMIIENHNVPTAATNGLNMWINPEWAATFDDAALEGLVLHEVLHVVYMHMDSEIYGMLNHRLLNIAGDHRINNDLTAWGFQIPDGGHCDSKYRCGDTWSTMDIYRDLEQDQDQNPEDQPSMSDIIMIAGGSDPDSEDQEGNATSMPSEALDPAEHREKIISTLVKAVQIADLTEDSGSVPGHIRRMVQEIMDPKIPWNVVLRNYMDEYNEDDYDWSVRDRNFRDVYVPDLYQEQIDQISIAVDASGSMSPKQLDEITAEARHIWESLAPKSMRVMCFDTKIHTNTLYQEGEYIEDLELAGGGGTDIGEVIETLHEDQPRVCLIFTDGYFHMPDLDNVYTDLIWIISQNQDFKPPKGQVIYYDY